MNLFTTIKRSIEPEPASIRKQTPFRCEYFDFGKATQPHIQYFNCGIVERPDGLWLVTRRARTGFNDVVAFELRDKTPLRGYTVKFLKSFADQHYEDPRAIHHDGQTYISTTTFMILGEKRWTRAHQTLSFVNEKWTAQRQISVQYGSNRRTVLDNVGMEKNWLWFFHNGRLHMLYMTVPHEVVPLDDDLKPEKSHITFPELTWKHGDPRGGTPPVRVGEEYWTFFHSSVPWINQKRRYSMGAYAFHAYPPFQMSRMTPKPILVGSRHDPWDQKKPACVFPCGSIIRNGVWTVTGGCNDLLSFWMDIPHDELVKLTEPVFSNEKSENIAA